LFAATASLGHRRRSCQSAAGSPRKVRIIEDLTGDWHRLDGRIEDLSKEIIKTVPRGPREQVTCRRISHNHYRCNWLRGAEIGIAGRILKSRFLKVTWNQGSLDIQDVTGLIT